MRLPCQMYAIFVSGCGLPNAANADQIVHSVLPAMLEVPYLPQLVLKTAPVDKSSVWILLPCRGDVTGGGKKSSNTKSIGNDQGEERTNPRQAAESKNMC